MPYIPSILWHYPSERSVLRNAPSALSPQCATRSASMNPGAHSGRKTFELQSCASGVFPAGVVETDRSSGCRYWYSNRSAIAGLIVSSRSGTSPGSDKCPKRSKAPTNSGRNGISRLEQIRLAAFHIDKRQTNGLVIACWHSLLGCSSRIPWFKTVTAYLRW